jgi:hypothetical protein
MKIQNERLEQRLVELRMQLDSESMDNSIELSNIYPASSLDSSTDAAQPLSTPIHDGLGAPLPYPISQTNDPQPNCVTSRALPDGSGEPDPFDDITKAKKVRHFLSIARRAVLTAALTLQMKKPQTTEQFLCFTCGRTVSPEWRKVCPKMSCTNYQVTYILQYRVPWGQRLFATLAACVGRSKLEKFECGRDFRVNTLDFAYC